jgi:hypothetical protein
VRSGHAEDDNPKPWRAGRWTGENCPDNAHALPRGGMGGAFHVLDQRT